jgi:hypothetical protein
MSSGVSGTSAMVSGLGFLAEDRLVFLPIFFNGFGVAVRICCVQIIWCSTCSMGILSMLVLLLLLRLYYYYYVFVVVCMLILMYACLCDVLQICDMQQTELA